MWKQKIGISIGNHYGMPIGEFLNMLRAIGFDAVSPGWKDYDTLYQVVSAARECALEVQSLHAPYQRAADLWSTDDTLRSAAKSEIFDTIDACADLNIPVLVMHTWIGFDYTFDAEAPEFSAYDEIVLRAEERGVKIAFENTEGEEYLFALMAHFADHAAVGFCWDSGHEMCYNHAKDLLAEFGDRLIMTHLNDNLGISRFDGKTFWTDDLHLLPYDGIIDWDETCERLKQARHLDILNFELNIHSKPNRHENDIYAQMPLEAYFTEAYKRACRIAYRYAR